MKSKNGKNGDSLADRRQFLGKTVQLAAAAGVMSSLGSWAPEVLQAANSKTEPLPKATADVCILVWLAGGMCQVDTLDPKAKGNGNDKPGSYFNSIKTSVPGIEVCEHLPQVAERMDHIAVLRTLNHNFPEHTQGVNILHTGRLPSGTVVYPSIGSIVAHKRESFNPKAPAYVVLGYPMLPRGPGFLGGKSNYIYLVDTEAGPAGLRAPDDLSRAEYERRVGLLKDFSAFSPVKARGPLSAAYAAAKTKGFEMMSDEVQSAFSVKFESAELRQRYGDEFGQRLLLSRRLAEHGVRFVECSFNLGFTNGTSWDTHGASIKEVHIIIRQLDRALAALIDDLVKRNMLERTLVVVATEFGRPSEFDGQGGRGHQSTAFSTLMFGGGVRGGQAIGATDEIGKEIVKRPISIPDFHATIHRALGIDPDESLMTPDGRPVPITDHGTPVEEVFVRG